MKGLILKNSILKSFAFYLLFCVIIHLLVIENFQLLISDDIPYLNVGYFLSLPYWDTYIGPIYPFYLKLFLKVFDNPLDAFRYSFLGSLLLIFTFLYGLLFREKRNVSGLVMLGMYFILFNPAIYSIYPKISFFCVVLLLGTQFLIRGRSWQTKWYILLNSSFLFAYSRPEFFLSFLLIGFIGIIFFLKNHLNWKLYVLNFGILLLSGLTLLGGVPLGNRALDAFKQHFVINYQKWNPHIKLSKYPRSEFDLFDKVYGKVNSFGEIFIQNPSYFFKHVFQNLLNIFETAIHFWNSFYVYFIKLIGLPPYVYLILMLGVLSQISFPNTIQQVKKKWKGWTMDYMLPSLFIIFPTFISILFIYPREHYLIFHLYFILGLLGLVCTSIEFKSKWVDPTLQIFVVAVFAIFIANPEKRNFGFSREDDLTPVFKKVQAYAKENPKTYYCYNLFDRVFFNTYFQNRDTLNRTFDYVIKYHPDVLYFRKEDEKDYQKFVKLPIIKEYLVDSSFVHQNIFIFVKNNQF